MEQKIIEFKNVTKKFGSKIALDNISFTVFKGQFHGFIGANGAGKTTSFRCLFDFYPDTKGEIFINGINSTDPKSKQKIGYIPEDSTFPKKLNVRDYLNFFCELSGKTKEESKTLVQNLMDKYEFAKELQTKNGNKLSSGEKKKVLLMQALISDPEILVLDEPAANLDPKIRIQLYEILKKLQKEGKTIFISSHILAELEQYIDSYTVIEKGKVYETKTIEEKSKSSHYNYYVTSAEIDKVEEIIKNFTLKSPFEFKKNKNTILMKLEPKQIEKISAELFKSGLNIESIGKYKVNLNELYFDVIKGE
ncbi:ABC transporter ATP-binding protein [Mycoplasma crocodyli]|uniref:ABC transporter, ATP-binding protein n=1 Tax=Mycoplasma crocodyli (strain ATCC 51981 / MP145) TaxID=512564 RepID=D5E4Q4_MYCCM|nr:ABC transporter ATP-binding protein [Mycoplasma crocodyli]ADE19939.1 ABC transporter, ATP-binding protein [Mycoplasma crocodyli MP145]